MRRSALARFSDEAKLLAGVFWPGPLTLVLPKAGRLPGRRSSPPPGSNSIAVRVPDHPIARDLLKAFGKPVVAPSANRSGHVSPTLAEHVRADLDGRIELILDGGTGQRRRRNRSCVCRPSAVSALLRPGGLPRDAIEHVLGHALAEGRACAGRGAARTRHARLAVRAENAAAAQCHDGGRTARKRCWRSATGSSRRIGASSRLNLSTSERPGRGRRESVFASSRARCRGRARASPQCRFRTRISVKPSNQARSAPSARAPG